MAGSLPTFNTEGAQKLLAELPFEIPSKIPDFSMSDNSAVYESFADQVQRLNPIDDDPNPVKDDQAKIDQQTRGSERAGLLIADQTSIELHSQAGYQNMASPASDDAEAWRFRRADRMTVRLPFALADVQGTLQFEIKASLIKPDGDTKPEPDPAIDASWFLHLGSVPALGSLGIGGEDLFSLSASSNRGRIEETMGIHAQGNLTNTSSQNRLAGMGIAILLGASPEHFKQIPVVRR